MTFRKFLQLYKEQEDKLFYGFSIKALQIIHKDLRYVGYYEEVLKQDNMDLVTVLQWYREYNSLDDIRTHVPFFKNMSDEQMFADENILSDKFHSTFVVILTDEIIGI